MAVASLRRALAIAVAIGFCSLSSVTQAPAQSAVDRAKVLATNNQFYETFRNGDLQGMDKVWHTTREIGMTPPNAQFLLGREKIMGLFALMMARPPEIECEMEGSVVFEGDKAIIICNEILGEGGSVRMMNVFGPDGEGEPDEIDWKMIYHGPVPDNWRPL